MAAIGFSAKAILVKLAYYHPIDAVSLLTLRMLFSTPFFLIAALHHGVRNQQPTLQIKDYLAVLLLGLSGYYLSSLFDFIGLQYISAGLERLILFLYPTLVVLLSAILLGKAFGRKEIVALLLSYAGIGLVFWSETSIQAEHLWLGAAFVFAGTLSYSLYLIRRGPNHRQNRRFALYGLRHAGFLRSDSAAIYLHPSLAGIICAYACL